MAATKALEIPRSCDKITTPTVSILYPDNVFEMFSLFFVGNLNLNAAVLPTNSALLTNHQVALTRILTLMKDEMTAYNYHSALGTLRVSEYTSSKQAQRLAGKFIRRFPSQVDEDKKLMF